MDYMVRFFRGTYSRKDRSFESFVLSALLTTIADCNPYDRAKYRELVKQLSPGSENTTLLAQISRKKAKVELLLKRHYEALSVVAPGLAHLNLSPDDLLKDPILLPSSFTTAEREVLELRHLASVEIKLRVAQCHEALEKLRRSLGVRSFLTRHGLKTNGHEARTRAQDAIKRAEHVVKQWAFLYRRGWDRLKVLGADTTTLGTLQVLHGSDLVMLSSWLEDEAYRKKHVQLPWIWTTALRPVEGALQPEVQNKLIAWNEEGK